MSGSEKSELELDSLSQYKSGVEDGLGGGGYESRTRATFSEQEEERLELALLSFLRVDRIRPAGAADVEAVWESGRKKRGGVEVGGVVCEQSVGVPSLQVGARGQAGGRGGPLLRRRRETERWK